MPGLKRNRKRPNTIAFHVSDAEKVAIETRINLSGLPKSEFYIESREKIGCDRWKIWIRSTECSVGKYECIFTKC